MNLDILSRGPLWEMGIDYKCGTGHGVGYVLNVHEGPNGFRWRVVPERHDNGVLEEGMITTDEPGVYLEGKYGIRTEMNWYAVRQKKPNMDSSWNLRISPMHRSISMRLTRIC